MNTHPTLQTSRRNRAFTLIELLTVIAIIGILAAIIFPVTGMVRAKARSSQCVSNLRQLGVATVLFAADNRDEVPYANYYSEVDTRWADKLASYVNVKFLSSSTLNAGSFLPVDPFRCPSSNYLAKPGNKSSYGKNYNINSEKGGSNYPSSRRTDYRFSEIDTPSRYYYLADAIKGSGENASWGIGTQANNLPSSKQGIELRHSDRGNILFMDFHVESLSASRIPVVSYGGPPWCPRQ